MNNEEFELAKDIQEDLAARMIARNPMPLSLNSDSAALLYHIVSEWIVQNELRGVDVKLPFDVVLSLGEVS